ncbi:glycoside hydrolase [Trametopsis cervina]|nr:glycoside hydrolase [Trametopsis cervina]
MAGLLKLSVLLSLLVHGALAATTVTVNFADTHQTMDGFGFSQAFGRANDLYNLPATARTNALDLLFSPTKGAGMTILRNRIGSGGTGDSIEPTSPGSPSAAPKYSWDGSDTHQVWLSQQALTYGVKTFYADAWSAPGFMKTNNDQDNGGYLCGVTGHTCSSGDWKQAYANFLSQYLTYYASVGVNITHVGFLNEPDYTTTYSSMLSDGTQAADFIKVLRPTLNNNGQSNVGIVCCDATGYSKQVTITSQMISAGVENSLAVVSTHAYSSDPTGPISTTRRVWETEVADLDGSFSTVWYANGAAGEGLTWANRIFNAIVNANFSAYLYWIGIEVGTTNSCLIAISNTSTVTPSKRLWAFGMFSRFVRPGAVRLGTSGSGANLKFAAFKNTDGTAAVLVINGGGSAQDIVVATSGYTAQSVQGFLTDNSNAIAAHTAAVSGGQVTTNVPAYGMVSLLLSGSPSSSGGSTPPVTSTTASTTSTPISTPTSSPTGCTSALYAQCAGQGYTGCTTCAAGSTCKFLNNYYSQCL